jgi:hypothetical protein
VTHTGLPFLIPKHAAVIKVAGLCDTSLKGSQLYFEMHGSNNIKDSGI